MREPDYYIEGDCEYCNGSGNKIGYQNDILECEICHGCGCKVDLTLKSKWEEDFFSSRTSKS